MKKNEILKLKREGKTCSEICKIVGCSQSLFYYHCGSIKTKNKPNIKTKTADFQRDRLARKGQSCHINKNVNFSWKDIVEKFGWETSCYLTGDSINLKDVTTYQFDHIVPVSKGGGNAIDNLGICTHLANKCKSDMYKEEFIDLCKSILEHNGFKVK